MVNSFFFFSSRRRHTRCYRDWSSDVCSSDLGSRSGKTPRPRAQRTRRPLRVRRTACREVAQLIQTELAPIGISVEIKAMCGYAFFNRTGIRGEPFDMALDVW